MKRIVCFHSDVDFRMTTHLAIHRVFVCEEGHREVRKTGDGLGTLNTEEMNEWAHTELGGAFIHSVLGLRVVLCGCQGNR